MVEAFGRTKKLKVDRLLAGFRKNAGIDTKGAKPYGGWEKR